MNAIVSENAKRRRGLRLRLQTHPEIGRIRNKLAEAARNLPAINPALLEKATTLSRRFVGGKMPRNVVQTYSCYTVRICVVGIVFSAAIFNALGGRENHKLCEPLARLADAITYRFRNSRMRGSAVYNFTVEQAQADQEVLFEVLVELEKFLIGCGVPILEWDTTQYENVVEGPSRTDTLEARMNSADKVSSSLEIRLKELEQIVNTLRARLDEWGSYNAPGHICVPTEPQIPKNPEVWCAAKL